MVSHLAEELVLLVALAVATRIEQAVALGELGLVSRPDRLGEVGLTVVLEELGDLGLVVVPGDVEDAGVGARAEGLRERRVRVGGATAARIGLDGDDGLGAVDGGGLVRLGLYDPEVGYRPRGRA